MVEWILQIYLLEIDCWLQKMCRIYFFFLILKMCRIWWTLDSNISLFCFRVCFSFYLCTIEDAWIMVILAKFPVLFCFSRIVTCIVMSKELHASRSNWPIYKFLKSFISEIQWITQAKIYSYVVWLESTSWIRTLKV